MLFSFWRGGYSTRSSARHVHAARHHPHTRRLTHAQPCSRLGTHPGQPRRKRVHDGAEERLKGVTRLSVCACAATPCQRKKKEVFMSRVEHDVVARLELKIAASNNDLRVGSCPALPPASTIVEDMWFCGRGSMFPKNARRNAARAKVCAVETAQEGPDHEYGLTLLAAFSFSCWLRWAPGAQSIATLSTKAASGDGAVSFITS